ncbi:MAG: hypothetical protein ABI560_14040, partial [Myxococcales bacterium]
MPLESAASGLILAAVILCASGLRFVSAGGDPEQLVRLAADAACDGLAIGAECTRGYVMPLIAAALSTGLTAPVMAALLAESPLGIGRRLPHLASLDDDDERRAAVALLASTLDLAIPLGVRHFTVTLGAISLGTDPRQVAWRFARRELLDEDEPGARLWTAARAERRSRSGAIVDACRDALDRILPMAERRDAAIAIEVAGDPWSVPTPRESLNLLAEYSGAPLGLVWDDARMQVLSTVGMAPAPDRRAALAAAATVWRASDAVGVQTGYLPGLGDPPPDFAQEFSRAARTATATSALVVVSGPVHSPVEEVAAAVSRVRLAT